MVIGGSLGCEPRRGGARGRGAVVARKMENPDGDILAWSIPKDLLVLRFTGNPLHPTRPKWCRTVGLLGRAMPLLLGECVQGGTGCAVFPHTLPRLQEALWTRLLTSEGPRLCLRLTVSAIPD